MSARSAFLSILPTLVDGQLGDEFQALGQLVPGDAGGVHRRADLLQGERG